MGAGGGPGLGPLTLQLRTCQLPAGEREVQVTAVQGFLRQGSHQPLLMKRGLCLHYTGRHAT